MTTKEHPWISLFFILSVYSTTDKGRLHQHWCSLRVTRGSGWGSVEIWTSETILYGTQWTGCQTSGNLEILLKITKRNTVQYWSFSLSQFPGQYELWKNESFLLRKHCLPWQRSSLNHQPWNKKTILKKLHTTICLTLSSCRYCTELVTRKQKAFGNQSDKLRIGPFLSTPEVS